MDTLKTLDALKTSWNSLGLAALSAAVSAKDIRAETIRSALLNGTIEGVLRQWSIISEADIKREFSVR